MNYQFRFKGNCEIIHINLRKEGAEDDIKVTAVDAKLKITTDKSVLDSFQASEFKDSLFTDIGAIRNIFIEPISMKYSLENYFVEIARERFSSVTLKKFTFAPKDGNEIVMTFTASFLPNSEVVVARLVEYLQDEVSLVVEPSNEELDLSESK